MWPNNASDCVKTKKFAAQWENSLVFHTKLNVLSLITIIENTEVVRNEHIFLRLRSFHTVWRSRRTKCGRRRSTRSFPILNSPKMAVYNSHFHMSAQVAKISG